MVTFNKTIRIPFVAACRSMYAGKQDKHLKPRHERAKSTYLFRVFEFSCFRDKWNCI